MPTRTETTTATTKHVTMDAAELLKALKLPKDAKVFVTVPGGGDWSNCDLELDKSTPLNIVYTSTKSRG